VYSKPGEARWFPPFRHTVENLGETSYSGVYIAVKGSTAVNRQSLQADEQAARILAAIQSEIVRK
jgi:hypothetical protein